MKNIYPSSPYRLMGLFGLIAFLTIQPAHSANLTYTATTTNVAVGGTLTFQIYGQSVNEIGGFSLYLQSSATGSQIELTNEVLGPDFTDGGFPAVVPQPLNGTPTSDLGAFTLADSLNANTSYLLATETIAVDPLTTPGTYTLFAQNGDGSGSVFFDPTFTLPDYVSANSFTINVTGPQGTPEPATWALMVGGLAFLIFHQIRRSRRA